MANRLLEKLLRLYLALGFVGFAMARFDATKYTNSSSLSSTYKIYWTIDKEQIFLAVQADTRGWVGFGIGEPTSGSMPGSDIFTGTVANDGKVTVQDRFATDFSTPEVDRCQDWKVIAGEMTEEGRTIIEVSRLLNTKDPQDRPLLPGSNRIVWAWGENDDISYHDLNRGALSFTFYGGTQETVSNSFTREYSLDGSPVPTDTNGYTAKAFALPVDKDYHLIRIEASVTVSLVQQVTLYGCTNNSDWIQARINQSSQVYTADDHVPSYCLSVLWVWTPDIEPLVLPEHAGFRISPSLAGIKFLVVQTHYYNPDEATAADNSVYTLTFTSQLRTHDAGVIQLGDPLMSMSRPIPARSEAAHYEFSCSPTCTKQWEHDITVWGSFLHMRKIGHRMYSAHYRDAKSLGPINSVEFFEQAYQHVVPAKRLVQKGDRINTNCLYRAVNKLNVTAFGIGAEQEACVDYLYYYPKLSARYCGYFERNSMNYSLCGGTSDLADERNPTARDPLLGHSFGNEGDCPIGEESKGAELVMKVSPGAMFGVCLLSTVIIVGMTGGLLWIALRTKDPRLENQHQQLEDH